MRIAFISTLYPPNIVGGAERVVQSVAEGLAAQGHECHVLALGKEASRVDRGAAGVHVHELPVRNLYWPFQSPRPGGLRRALWHAVDSVNPWMAREVGRLLDEIQPNVVNSHNIAGFSVAAWSAVKRRRIPLVHTLHDQYLLCPNSTMFRRGRNCETQCAICRVYSAPRIARSQLPDMVTGVSRFILDRHRRFGCFSGVPQGVIYNAYECPQDAQRARRGTPTEDPLRFGFLGRLHESKGVERLLDAFLGMPAGVAELLIAGTGDAAYVENLKQKSAQRQDVRWLGFVKPESLLGQVDVMVIPSLWHDTAPLVALEALTWGLPLLVSDRGGLPELAPPAVGWSFDPDDTRALSGLLQVCVEQREGLQDKSAAALKAARGFSKDAMLRGYVAAYESVMRETSGAE